MPHQPSKFIRTTSTVALMATLLVLPQLALAEDGSGSSGTTTELHQSDRGRLASPTPPAHTTDVKQTNTLTTTSEPSEPPEVDDTKDKAATSEAVRAFKAAKVADRLTRLREVGSHMVTQRQNVLAKLRTRVQADTVISATDKSTLLAMIDAAVSGLGQFTTKFTADTTLDTLKTDVKSLPEQTRDYLVVIPQVEGLLAADRLQTVVTKVSGTAAAIQNQIITLKSAGRITAELESALATYQTALSSAAQNITSAKQSFQAMKVSDVNGSKSLAQTGRSALQATRKDLSSASLALKTAIKHLQSSASSSAPITTPTATSIPITP